MAAARTEDETRDARLLFPAIGLAFETTAVQGVTYRSCYQAGMSVEGITDIQPVAAIVAEYAGALRALP